MCEKLLDLHQAWVLDSLQHRAWAQESPDVQVPPSVPAAFHET
jgi:hypothetical protein